MAEYRRQRRRTHAGVERRSGRLRLGFLLPTGVVGLAIVFCTLCPPELRPSLATANEERFWAFFLLGFLAALTAPRRVTVVSVALVVVAFGLEAAQRFMPGRDGSLQDAILKGFGGMLGAQCGVMTFAARRWMIQAWQTQRAARRGRRGGGVQMQTGLRPTGARL